MRDMNQIVGSHDILLITLDTLRYDVAQALFKAGKLPNFAQVLPATGWECRHSPGNFTYAAHHAFFAGFLPTPIAPGIHPRLFAVKFAGSSTTTEKTCVFDSADIVTGLAKKGYHTVCIGGVGFFNQLTPLSQVFPRLFTESYWHPKLGVTDRNSTANQIDLAAKVIKNMPPEKRLFLFMNISALHQPNYFYLHGANEDSLASHGAALEYVDSQVGRLWQILRDRAPTFCMICSDHGTAYGENGYSGHRVSHPVIWTVPYADFVLK